MIDGTNTNASNSFLAQIHGRITRTPSFDYITTSCIYQVDRSIKYYSSKSSTEELLGVIELHSSNYTELWDRCFKLLRDNRDLRRQLKFEKVNDEDHFSSNINDIGETLINDTFDLETVEVNSGSDRFRGGCDSFSPNDTLVTNGGFRNRGAPDNYYPTPGIFINSHLVSREESVSAPTPDASREGCYPFIANDTLVTNGFSNEGAPDTYPTPGIFNGHFVSHEEPASTLTPVLGSADTWASVNAPDPGYGAVGMDFELELFGPPFQPTTLSFSDVSPYLGDPGDGGLAIADHAYNEDYLSLLPDDLVPLGP
ncbi:hypothetical protein K435DRAFT_967172 [Dendrothele bispora CBS 962.96]|uniref:Uncharacterized protein n=1 Tax=Dendrothele bispora (strain CBS 962.96) TaxID=1314807 RepID=A0A4S8LW99_DENBC|nr:hypothetical protein K435DRAFT_967172 [Dendrothele bispora CBS 962.96]